MPKCSYFASLPRTGGLILGLSSAERCWKWGTGLCWFSHQPGRSFLAIEKIEALFAELTLGERFFASCPCCHQISLAQYLIWADNELRLVIVYSCLRYRKANLATGVRSFDKPCSTQSKETSEDRELTYWRRSSYSCVDIKARLWHPNPNKTSDRKVWPETAWIRGQFTNS